MQIIFCLQFLAPGQTKEKCVWLGFFLTCSKSSALFNLYTTALAMSFIYLNRKDLKHLVCQCTMPCLQQFSSRDHVLPSSYMTSHCSQFSDLKLLLLLFTETRDARDVGRRRSHLLNLDNRNIEN